MSTNFSQRLDTHLPAGFRNLRDKRYGGESFDLSLAALSPVDRVHIERIYGFTKNIHTRWVQMREHPDWEALRTMLRALLSPPLSTAAGNLGVDSLAQRPGGKADQALGKVIHDLRGGALMPLQLYAHMAESDADTVLLRRAAFLARDQAKIMRNALPDLDPELRRADESEKPHDMQAVVEKWHQFRFERADHGAGEVMVECTYDGLLASCCLEASAVDRIVYNYINNAMRFAQGPHVYVEIVPVGEHAVRWIVANPISPEHTEWLGKHTGGNLSQLFRGGVTQGGNGVGLSNCADFVTAAFGLPDIDTALDGRYLGAAVEDGWYLAWAHWPALYRQ